MKRLNKDSIRRYLESGLLVGCASAVISLVLTLVTWFQKEVTQPGPLTTVAHLNSWVIDNPIDVPPAAIPISWREVQGFAG